MSSGSVNSQLTDSLLTPHSQQAAAQTTTGLGAQAEQGTRQDTTTDYWASSCNLITSQYNRSVAGQDNASTNNTDSQQSTPTINKKTVFPRIIISMTLPVSHCLHWLHRTLHAGQGDTVKGKVPDLKILQFYHFPSQLQPHDVLLFRQLSHLQLELFSDSH